MLRLSRYVPLLAIATLFATPAVSAASERVEPQVVVPSQTEAVSACDIMVENIVRAETADSVVYFLIIVPVHYIETDSHSPPTKVDSMPTFLHSVATRRDLTKRVGSDSANFRNMKNLSHQKLSIASAKSGGRYLNRRA